MEKVKLMCSYGGKINHRNHDRKLVYVGGDIKILTVDRNISFTNLIAKLNALCEYNSDIRVKYMLPGQDLDALISVFDDEDLENMLIEADLLRRSSPTPPRLRLFVFFPVTVTTPVTERSVNPDFLFGFDKEYSLNYTAAVNNYDNTDTVVSPPVNVGGPVQIQEIPAKFSENSMVTRGSYVYPTPIMYGAPIISNGYFQSGQHTVSGNRDQPVVYGFIPGDNREQPVVYGFIPVIPSGPQEQSNIPMSGIPLSYDAARGELQLPTSTATANHEPKVANGSQLEAA